MKEVKNGGVLGTESRAGIVLWNSQSPGCGSIGLVQSHAPATVTFWKDGSPFSCMAVPEPIACAETGTGMMGKGELNIYEKGLLMKPILYRIKWLKGDHIQIKE